MNLKWLFEKWNLSSLKVNVKFLEAEFTPKDEDKDAAWSLYVELLTRITTQELKDDDGDEKTALNSVYQLFPLTRSILKEYGRNCIHFSKIAVIVLNQIIRPFTAKWHKLLLNGYLDCDDKKREFRSELKILQQQLQYYTSLLSDLAEVEDLTGLEEKNPLREN